MRYPNDSDAGRLPGRVPVVVTARGTQAKRWLLQGASLLMALVAVSACATRGGTPGGDTLGESPDAASASMAAPRLVQLRPDTIALGRGEVPTIVLTGSGFIPGATGAFGTGANRVRVGRATIEGVAADSSGTVLRFPLPLTYTDTTAKGRPSSFSPGEYPVSVVTPRGTSNTLTLTMIP